MIAGSVDPDALVRAGQVAAAHMPAIDNALREVKQANAAAGGVEADGAKRAKLAAVRRAKSAAGR